MRIYCLYNYHTNHCRCIAFPLMSCHNPFLDFICGPISIASILLYLFESLWLCLYHQIIVHNHLCIFVSLTSLQRYSQSILSPFHLFQIVLHIVWIVRPSLKGLYKHKLCYPLSLLNQKTSWHKHSQHETNTEYLSHIGHQH